jgi:hypothetical protein
MNPLKSKRAALWLTGMFLLIGGFLGAAIFLPHRAEPYGAGGEQVQLPSMENVPGPNAPRLEIDVPAADPADAAE